MVPFLLWVLGNSNPYSPVEKKQREAVTSGSVEYISWPRIVQNVLSFCLYLLKISYKVSDLTLGPGGPGGPGRPWKTNREQLAFNLMLFVHLSWKKVYAVAASLYLKASGSWGTYRTLCTWRSRSALWHKSTKEKDVQRIGKTYSLKPPKHFHPFASAYFLSFCLSLWAFLWVCEKLQSYDLQS